LVVARFSGMAGSALWMAFGGALLVALSGCSSASNSAWLREPEAGMALDADLVGPLEQRRALPIEALGAVRPAEAAPIPDPSGMDAGSRPRLMRTVTLGETLGSAPQPEPAGAGTAGAPVQVTINNYATVPGYDAVPVYASGYAPLYPRQHGGGRVDGERGSRAQVKPASANIIPGRDFPAPRSYGPSFPYKTAPASPWK
jgi:hypothetical protein